MPINLAWLSIALISNSALAAPSGNTARIKNLTYCTKFANVAYKDDESGAPKTPLNSKKPVLFNAFGGSLPEMYERLGYGGPRKLDRLLR
jgi:hypothetical protein